MTEHKPVTATPQAPAVTRAHPLWTIAGVIVLLGLAALVHWLTVWVPQATKGTGFGKVAKSIEFPIYAIIIGFGANALLSALGVRKKMSAAFRTCKVARRNGSLQVMS